MSSRARDPSPPCTDKGQWAEGQEGLTHSKEPDPRSLFGPMSIDSFPCPDIPSPSGTQARGNSTIFFIY